MTVAAMTSEASEGLDNTKQSSKSSKKQSMTPGMLCQLERRERRRMRKQSEKRHYQHVPRSAASDFARTTTPDPLKRGQIHRLSHPAAGHTLGESYCEANAPSLGGIEDVFEGAMEAAVARAQLSRPKTEINRETILRKRAMRRSLDVYQQLQRSEISPKSSVFSDDESGLQSCQKISSHERHPLISQPSEGRPRRVGDEHMESRKGVQNSLTRKKSEILEGIRDSRNLEKSTEVMSDDDSDLHGRSSWKCVCFLR